MSLQAWYPLNGSAQDLGVNPIESEVSSEMEYVDMGKVGIQSLSDGTISWPAEKTAQILNNDAISIAFWINPRNASSGQIFGTDSMGAMNNRKFSIYAYSTGQDFHLSWMNDTTEVFLSTEIKNVFPLYKWTHCCVTYQNPITTIYINGTAVQTLEDKKSSSSSFAYATQVIHGSPNRYLSDFRVYDHCLSPKEVKILSQGLIAHYKLNSESKITYDCSGYKNNGIAKDMAGISTDTPRHENSYVFNGTSSYIDCGRGAMISDAITVSCWGYMDNWSEYNNRRLISCTQNGGWNFEPKNVNNTEDISQGMNFAVKPLGQDYLGATDTINTNKVPSAGWHLFTGTYDGYIAKLYIDGKFVGQSIELSEKTPISYNPNNRIFIGAEAGKGNTPDGGYFKGKISDVRIYSTALSAKDIQELYEVRASVEQCGNLYCYDFVERATGVKYISIGKNGAVTTQKLFSGANKGFSVSNDKEIKALNIQEF